jgi:hypothetical protein
MNKPKPMAHKPGVSTGDYRRKGGRIKSKTKKA